MVFDDARPEGPQKFNSVNGSVEVRLSDDVNADIKAETLSGAIKLDEAFGLIAEKRVASSQVIGRIGAGGAPLLINTVNGDIVISK